MWDAKVPFKPGNALSRTGRTVYRGRFAPSPTGALHFGSLVAAVASWLRARSMNGIWLVRIEDIDPPREVTGASESILTTLAAFGMVPDETVLFQNTRGGAYAAALDRLRSSGDVFPCACSRTEVQARGGHRGVCDAPTDDLSGGIAWRMLAPDAEIGFDDAIQGRFNHNLCRDVGDFVLRRADGLWAYQLAVVIDDADQGITEIVRGADLLDSTPRQVHLQQRLNLPTPGYAHLPVLLGEDGQKLSKQTLAAPIDPDDPIPMLRRALRVLGIAEADGIKATMPGQLLHAAIPFFSFSRLPRTPSLRSATWTSLANG